MLLSSCQHQSQIELFAVCFKCCFEASLDNLLREDVEEKKFVE
jgi:hypothetical protein